MNITILRFDEIASTNTEALRLAMRGAEEGLCVIAERQTAGRGRHGRAWVSPPRSGLYFSIILRPGLSPAELGLTTLMAAVSVHDVIEEIAKIDCDIKWVNDILVGERKISGILAETVDSPGGLAVVAGIGVNLRDTELPPEIAARATSVETESGTPVDTELFLEKLIASLRENYDLLGSADGRRQIRDAWTARSTYANGKSVRVILENEEFTGVTAGIEESGALRVRQTDGKIRVIHAGDIERLRSAEAK